MMLSTIKRFYILLRKDLRTEILTAESLTLTLAIATLTVALISYAIEAAFIAPDIRLKLFPSLIWVIFLFVATVQAERGFDHEAQHQAYQGLLLAGVKPAEMYLARTICLALRNIAAFFLLTWLLSYLMGIQRLVTPIPLTLLASPGIISYSALSSLLSVIINKAQARSLVLPLIMLPLLFPVLAGSIELAHTTLTDSPSQTWLYLESALAIFFLSLGTCLYGAAMGK